PATITTADGKTYELVPELTSGQETGTVVPGNTDVTYVYKEVKKQPGVPNNENKPNPEKPNKDSKMTPHKDNTPVEDDSDMQSPKAKAPSTVNKQSVLPSTGEEDSTTATVGGLALLLGALGLAGKRRRKN
ncbi:LPXTG cell wall anchor domain-containing protein, partial [Streptococcus sciuri]